MRISDLARPLYVSRLVQNTDDIVEWAKSQGLTTMLSPEELHVTICYSKEAFDWSKAGDGSSEVVVEAIDPNDPKAPVRQMEMFGKEHNVLVLQIESDELTQRWQEFRDAGASYDFPDYKPHITITYEGSEIDSEELEPYWGEIILGEEVFKEIKEEWSGDAKEIDLTESVLSEAKMEVIDGLRVFINPTASQLSQLCDRGELRGVATEEAAYLWSSGGSIHMDAMRKLGLDMKYYGARFYAFLPEADETERDWSRYGDAGNRGQQLRNGVVISAKQHAFETLKRTPCIARWFAPRPVNEAVEEHGDIRFYRNTNRGQIIALMRKCGELRGCAHGGDIWVWNANDAIDHQQAQRLLGVRNPDTIDFYITTERPRGEGAFSPLAIGGYWVAADWTDMPRLERMGVFRRMQGGRAHMGESAAQAVPTKFWSMFEKWWTERLNRDN